MTAENVVRRESHFEVWFKVIYESHKDNTPNKINGEEPLVDGGVATERRFHLEIKNGETPETAFERFTNNLAKSDTHIDGKLQLIEVLEFEVLRAESELITRKDGGNEDSCNETIRHYHQR